MFIDNLSQKISGSQLNELKLHEELQRNPLSLTE